MDEGKGSYIVLILNSSGIKSFSKKKELLPEYNITDQVMKEDNNYVVGIDELWVETNSGKLFNISNPPILKKGEEGDALEIRATGSKMHYQFKTLYQGQQISYKRCSHTM
jgi:hypothetical protein